MTALACGIWRGLAAAFGIAMISVASAVAQDTSPPEGWVCDDSSCTEIEPVGFLEIVGTFSDGSRLSTGENADEIAALEQQSQREFEFTVNEAALISVSLRPDEGYRPEGWEHVELPVPMPEPLLWVSEDGEDFERLTKDMAVRPGDLLLVAVRQVSSQEAEGFISYLPARWTLSLGQRRVVSGADAIVAGAAPLVPTLISADTDPLPEVPADTTTVPPVEGAAQLTDSASHCAGADCDASAEAAPSAPVDNELAIELQRELARVGCYSAEIDGLWGPASRRALAAFNAAQGTGTDDLRPSPRALVAVGRAQALVCAAQ